MKRQRGGVRRGGRTERDDGALRRAARGWLSSGERLRLDVRAGDVCGESGDEDGERLAQCLRWRVRLQDRSVVMSSRARRRTDCT